jgi:hypothetical protein
LGFDKRSKTGFDFAAFREAFETKDLDHLVPFYDAKWTDYRHASPPRASNRMIGEQQIAGFRARVRVADSDITIADDVLNAVAHIEGGKIARRVGVEARDN